MSDKPTALRAVTRAAADARTAERRALKAKAARDEAILAAQATGATYPELAEAAHLTRARVSQVLQEQRAQAAAQITLPTA